MKDNVWLEKYSEMLALQEALNSSLREAYESNREKGRDFLASFLIGYVETLIERTNSQGHTFGRVEYGGDVGFENSEQIYSDGKEIGDGVVLHFLGFSVQAILGGETDMLNNRRHSDVFSIAASPPFQSHTCCGRYEK